MRSRTLGMVSQATTPLLVLHAYKFKGSLIREADYGILLESVGVLQRLDAFPVLYQQPLIKFKLP
jgi:hypothetical protein